MTQDANAPTDTNKCPCPHCGKQVSSDLWEFAEGSHVTDCDHCQKPVRLSVHVAVDYAARPLTPDEARREYKRGRR